MTKPSDTSGKWDERCNAPTPVLRETESMFRLLFERSMDPIWLFDPQAGVFVDCNQAAVNLLGAGSRELMLQAHPTDFAPPLQPNGQSSRDFTASITAKVESDGGHRFEWLGRKLDGTDLPLEVVATSITSDGKKLHVIIAREITDRKKTENALRASQQLLSSVMESIDEALYRTGPDHSLTFANKAYLRLFGYDSIDAVRSTPRERLYANPSDRGQLINQLRQDGRFGPSEIEFARRDGGNFWGLISSTAIHDPQTGTLLYHVGSVTDVTERKRTEGALRESEARFRQLFERSADAISLIDGQTGRFIDANHACVDLMKFPGREELLGQTPSDVSPEFQPNGRRSTEMAGEVITRALAANSVRFEWVLRRFDGSEFYGEVALTKIQQGDRTLLMSITRDISERKRMEEQLRQLNATLERRIADRTAELTQSEARARTLVEHAPEAIVVFDGESGLFLECNENATRLYGLPREELLQRHPAEVSPPMQPDGTPSLQAAREKIQQACAGGTPVFEWTHRHSSGRLVPCEVRLVRLPAEGRTLLRGSVIDNTERERRERVQRATYQISEAVHMADNLDNLYQRIHAIVKSLMPAENFYIALFDAATETISFPYFLDEHGHKPAPFKLGTGLTGFVLRTGRPFLLGREMNRRKKQVGKAVTFEGFEEISYIESGKPAEIWLGVPLTVQGKPLGVMAVQDYHNPTAYGDEEKQILTFVAAQTALAIDRKRAEQALRERTERVLRHRNVLLELAQLDKSDFHARLERICALAAETLNTARVSYWSAMDAGSAIYCELLYALEGGCAVAASKGSRLQAAEYPDYFSALATHQMIVANHAESHQATRELAEGYLKPLGIGSMLDAPVWLHGRVVGVLCHEHIGPPREWTVEEIDFASSLATMVSLTFEAAQRTRSELALRESEEKHRALFEVSSQGVMLHDEKAFLEVNPAALRILGYETADQLIGRHPVELAPILQPDGTSSAVVAQKHINDCMTKGNSRFEWTTLNAKGASLDIEVILTRIPTGGSFIIQAIIDDITERKMAEAELLKSLAREKELGQLKSNFVSMVSHEFRTPLGIIMSSANILEDYLDQLDPEERKHHLESIHKNTRRMAEMMEEVLLIGRLDAGRMEFQPAPIDLRGVCQKLTDEIVSATERRCPIEFLSCPLGGDARADERLLQHVFTNLLNNAVKYSEPGRAVRFQIERDKGDAVCVVRDHGIGIPEADLPWLFNAFHRGRNVGQRAGTGLGLVIVKRCVELHGGTIKVESQLGEGTTITVRLPVYI
ncbi:MAG: PAS domain S-box protein [Opitutaceae bacterium]|nr:PAS domain S-box protein [Verrucomicrobiales bacterium]